MTNILCLINFTDADINYATTPAYYIEIDLANDRLIWTKGSDEVYDNSGVSPTDTQLDDAASIILDIPYVVPFLFLDDVSSPEKLFLVNGNGPVDKQFVFCFSFDGPTASEPTLEAWDNTTHLTADINLLGLGTPSNSMLHAICTTTTSPGSNWYGTKLAGINKLLLNDGLGALVGAKDLYTNMYIKLLPDTVAETSQFVLTVRYTYS